MATPALSPSDQHLFTPAQAARLLGVSRPLVMKMIASGELPSILVGTHHRIAAEDLAVYRADERTRALEAMRDLAEFQNQAGLLS